MPEYDPNMNHRRSIRLRGYDYSQEGIYFVTVCTHGKRSIFGEIREDEMALSTAGQAVSRIWEGLPAQFPNCSLDAFVVMPNHVHGIIVISNEVTKDEGAASSAPTDCYTEQGAASSAPTITHPEQGAASSAPTALGAIVRAFKSISAIQVNRLLDSSGQHLWQRNYYDHIIRSEDELNGIREYIYNNPIKWAIDRENPSVKL